MTIQSPQVLLQPRQSARYSLMLVLMFTSTLPYFFVGPLPAWIFFGVVCAGLGLLHNRLGAQIINSRQLFVAIMAWGVLIAFMLVLDIMGYQKRSISSGPALSFFTLLAFLGVLSAASYTSPTTTTLTVMFFTLLQGCVAILQFLGFTAVWDVAETMASLFPFLVKLPELSVWETTQLGFELYGRTRGTHFYIHVFNGIQSALVSYALFVRFHNTDPKLKSPGRTAFMTAAVLLGMTGLLLSFSRSGLLAVVLALIITLTFRPKFDRTAKVIVGGVVFLLFALLLNIDEVETLDRLTNFDAAASTNSSRLEHIAAAIDSFLRNPLIGASGVPNVRELSLPIHSVVLRFLNDYGLIGFSLYLLILGCLSLFYLSATRAVDDTVRMWGGCGLCVVGAIIADSWFHSSGFMRRDVIHAVLLALVAGNILAAKRRVLIQAAPAGR